MVKRYDSLKITKRAPDMKKLNNKGFSAVETILVLVIVGLIGFVGWYVYNSKKEVKNTSNTQQPSGVTKSVPNTKKDAPVTLKEYKNATYGFSFQYPENWTLKESLADAGRGAPEGEVIVTSPAGTSVYFRPNLGGKGGDCWDDQANDRTTRTCSTRTIYSVDKLASSSDANPVYFYKASYTAATRDGGATDYVIYIGNGKYAPTKPSSEIGAFITYWGEITPKYGEVGVKVEGKDKAIRSTKTYFDSAEVKEATPVLLSFKIE